MTKPNPCPFCGSSKVRPHVFDKEDEREGFPTAMVCMGCTARGPWAYEKEDSHDNCLRQWNERHKPQEKNDG